MRSDFSRDGKKAFLNERSAHSSQHINQYPHEYPAFLVGMDSVIPEIMHIYDLNIDKQLNKQGIMRHLDPHTHSRVLDFYSGMGAALTGERSDNSKSEKWWKAAFRAGMVLGNQKFPGGVAAWLPSLILLIGECMLEKREAIRAGGSGVNVAGADLDASASSSRLNLEQRMYGKYGKSLGKTLFLVLQAYDAYTKVRHLVDKEPDSNSAADKEALALAKACAGGRLPTHPDPPL